MPEEVRVSQTVIEQGKTKKQVMKKRVVKQVIDGKEQITEIVTIQEDDQVPMTTVTVSATKLPVQEATAKSLANQQEPDALQILQPIEETTIEEHPEVVEEVRSDTGVVKKKVVKKKIIKKRVGPKEEVTEEVTVEEMRTEGIGRVRCAANCQRLLRTGCSIADTQVSGGGTGSNS